MYPPLTQDYLEFILYEYPLDTDDVSLLIFFLKLSYTNQITLYYFVDQSECLFVIICRRIFNYILPHISANQKDFYIRLPPSDHALHLVVLELQFKMAMQDYFMAKKNIHQSYRINIKFESLNDIIIN